MFILLRRLALSLFCCLLVSCSTLDFFSKTDPASVAAPEQSAPVSAPKKVVLLLPLQGALSGAGAAVRDGFIAAYNNDNSSQKPLRVSVIDTSQQPIIEAYKKAVQDNADAIVGPLAKNDLQALIQSNSISVPTLALNYLDSKQKPPAGLVQFGLSPLDEARQAAALAYQNGGQRAMIIAPRSNWGQTLAQAYQDEWQTLGGSINAKLFFSEDSAALNQEIRNVISNHKTDTDVIFLAASPMLARQIKPLLKFYYAGDIPVYATSLVYTGTPQAAFDNDLNGIIFCDTPWTLNSETSAALKLRRQIALFWPANFKQNPRLYALGVDAYALIKDLSNLAGNAPISMAGATGNLSINNQRQINRALVCTQFQQGAPKSLETTPDTSTNNDADSDDTVKDTDSASVIDDSTQNDSTQSEGTDDAEPNDS